MEAILELLRETGPACQRAPHPPIQEETSLSWESAGPPQGCHRTARDKVPGGRYPTEGPSWPAVMKGTFEVIQDRCRGPLLVPPGSRQAWRIAEVPVRHRKSTQVRGGIQGAVQTASNQGRVTPPTEGAGPGPLTVRGKLPCHPLPMSRALATEGRGVPRKSWLSSLS